MYLQNVTSELGEFAENKKCVILSKSESFVNSYFSNSLNENHKRVLKMANLKGRQMFFMETFGIGYLLSILCYGTYLVSIGSLNVEDLSLSLYALYAALGLRGINSGYSELKEKTGIL